MKQELDKRTLEPKENGQFDTENGKKGNFNNKKKRGKRNHGYNRHGNSSRYGGKQSNDPAWHGRNSQLLIDLCSKPFNTMLGFAARLGGQDTQFYLQVANLKSYYVDWYPGTSDDFRSFLNTAATNIWEFIRSRNSGATNYGFGDIFTNVIIGCADIMVTANYLARFFKMTKTYSVFNRMIPKYLFELCHVNYEDFVSNIANYRGRYNILLAKASAIVIPSQFPLYDWITSMFSDIYKDRDSSTGREQLFISVKKNYKIYSGRELSTGGIVRNMAIKDMIPDATESNYALGFSPNSGTVKFSYLLDLWETQINAIITDEDCNIIFGDLIKAYGSEASFWKASPIEESQQIEPVYSEEFLLQYHNAILLPNPDSGLSTATYNGYRLPIMPRYSWLLKQDNNGYLITEYMYQYLEATLPEALQDAGVVDFINHGKTLLDCNDLNPTPERVMTMTRYHNRYTYDSSTKVVKVKSASAIILFDGNQVSVGANNVIHRDVVPQFYTNNDDHLIQFPKLAVHTNFDWNKMIYCIAEDASGHPTGAVQVLGDINNIQPLTPDELANIHDVDYASLYDIPFTKRF